MQLTTTPYVGPYSDPRGGARNRTTLRVAAAMRAQAQSHDRGKGNGQPAPGLPVVVEAFRPGAGAGVRASKHTVRSFSPFLAQLIVQTDRQDSPARQRRRRPAGALDAYGNAANLKNSQLPTPPGSALKLTDV